MGLFLYLMGCSKWLNAQIRLQNKASPVAFGPHSTQGTADCCYAEYWLMPTPGIGDACISCVCVA